MRDLGQVFAGKAELIGQIVVASGDDYFARAVVVGTAGAVGGRDAEVPVFAHDRFDPLVLANIEMVMLGDLAVVLESLFASRLLRARW